MKTYTVQIQTSVSVEADNPDEASLIAQDWAMESLADSNAVVKVFEGKAPKPVLEKSLF